MIRLAADTRDQLGEGPCWVAAEQRLYWLDIRGRKLRWLAPATGETGVFHLPVRASCAAARASGGLVLATDDGVAAFDTATDRFVLIEPIALPPGFRTNDGKVDPQGRFWWSSMDDAGGERPGAIYVTLPDGGSEQVLDGIHIANAISVTADGAVLYLADSRLSTLWAYDLADLPERRVFATTPDDVAPDGSALDAEGFLWNAQWGGARVVRYAPDGRIDRVVEVPVDQPTSCAFGGEDLATLFVTSAWDGLAPEARARQPLAGSLFAFEPGVPGLRLPAFRG